GTAKFAWLADFEQGTLLSPDSGNYGPRLVPSCGCNTKTAIAYSPGFGGKGYCLALMPNSDTTASVQTDPLHPIGLPAGGVGVYMELNYQSNVTIHVYVSTSGSGLTDCG